MTKVNSFQDGPRLTVSQLIKRPTLIQTRMLADFKKHFLVDSILRTLPRTTSGVYEYTENDPLFMDGEAEVVEEFGEIPTVSGQVGGRKVAFTVKRALALMVSQEMVDRNDMDRVNKDIARIRNTMTRTWERAFFTVLVNHPDVQTINASASWDQATAAIRSDLGEGMRMIEEAEVAGQPEAEFDFEADTLIIGTTTKADLIGSDDFNKVYRNSDLARQAPEFTGTLPGEFYGLNIMVSKQIDRMAPGRALLLQRKVVGGIGDERPLRTTPLYEDKPRETWRSDTSRRSAIVVDQPKAALWINGVSV